MGRWRGCIWLTAGVVVAILAGAVAFVTIQGAIERQETGEGVTGPEVDVVVAVQAIEVRTVISAEDVDVKTVPLDAKPGGALSTKEEVVGKVTTVDLYPGEILLAQRLVDPNVITGDGRLALIISEAEDEVLMAFPIQDLMSRIGVLKAGDHVDILFSLDFPVEQISELPTGAEEGGAGGGGGAAAEEASEAAVIEDELFSFQLLQNVTIAAIVGGPTSTREDDDGPPEALLLTVSPQDALLLKFAKDAGGIVDIVLRAPGVERPFETEPVDIYYMIDELGIPEQVIR